MRVVPWLVVLGALYLQAAASAAAPPVGRQIDQFSLPDVLGTVRSLGDWKDRRAIVVVFLGTECPLANRYAPRLVALADRYKDRHVQFVAIDSNQQDTLAQIAHFVRVHKISFPVLKDPGNKVADLFGAVRTPEVFLLDQGRTVRYWGQIDDQFGVDYARGKAAHRYLEEALDDLLAGKKIRTSFRESVGCRISRVNRRPGKGDVTYSNQVSRILQSRCVTCHRPGEVAPFALTTYSQAAGWAETIRDVIREQRMPPWHANPDFGQFANDCRLTGEEKRLIEEWIDNGVPEGDRAQLPPKIVLADGWRIPGPDFVVRMPKPFKVPATGIVDYQYFVVDPGFKHDVWVRDADRRPGNRSVVHHMVLFYNPPGQDEPDPAGALFRAIGSFAPGTPAMRTPKGIARRIPAGSKLVFQMHYTPNGAETTDQSEVGLNFVDAKTVRKEMAMGAVVNFKFLIPPGKADLRVDAAETFDANTLIYAFLPHMHFRGKSFRFTAIYPDGKKEILLDVPRYDFNWQNVYWLVEPKLLPAGSRLLCNASYDNSALNLANPDPNQFVHWGDQTWDEMFVGSYYFCSAEQDLSLGAPRVVPLPNGRFQASFRYRPASPALAVYLAGTFNKWKPTGLPMTGPDKDGWFHAAVELPPGDHEYKFVLNGKTWRSDPGNPVQTGEYHNSVLSIRP